MEAAESGLIARHQSVTGELDGFALTGGKTAQRAELAKKETTRSFISRRFQSPTGAY